MSLTQQEKGVFSQLYNRVEGLRAGKPGVGNVFWVDNVNGSNTLWNGRRPTTGQHKGGPFATVTHALTQCTSYADDYILVLRGGGETYPIAVAVDRVHIIGITNPGTPQTVGGYYSGVVGCLTIDADHVEIAGLTFLADATHEAIEILDKCWGLWIHHCSFGEVTGCQDGIYAEVEGPAGGLIEHNVFGNTIARDGCRLFAPTRSRFLHNLFRTTSGIGINITAGGCFAEIFGNRFIGHNVDGDAITISGAGSIGGIVANNWVAYGKAAAIGYLPFVDVGTNHWAYNLCNSAITVPA